MASSTVRLHWSKCAQSLAPSMIFCEKGTVAIDSISQFQGITLCGATGKRELLFGTRTKVEVMRDEARAFHREICGQSNTVSLHAAQDLMRKAHALLQAIRLSGGAAYGV
jgi:predicted dehydrogenase